MALRSLSGLVVAGVMCLVMPESGWADTGTKASVVAEPPSVNRSSQPPAEANQSAEPKDPVPATDASAGPHPDNPQPEISEKNDTSEKTDSSEKPDAPADPDAPAEPQLIEKPTVDLKSKALFDGKDLHGWTNPYEWGNVEVIDGEIQLVADKKFFLVTQRVFHDFEFEGELKLPEGKSNSGFMARGQVEPNLVYGYQAEADPTDRRWSGGLYDESRRQWLYPLWNKSEAQSAFDRNRWNRYRIRCVGDHLQFFVNDVPTTDYFDPTNLSGTIGLQHHGEKGQTYRFRNLTMRELGRHQWTPIFNSEILAQTAGDDEVIPGFKSIGGGAWTVANGVLQGRASSEANEPNGLLYSTKDYGDATFRIIYRFKKGDSGFFVRSQITGANPFVKGVQCEIDESEQVGGLYQTGGKGWVAQPLHYLAKRFPPDRRDVVRSRWNQARQGVKLDEMKLKRSRSETQSGDESSEQSNGDDSTDDGIESAPWQTMVVSVHGKRIVTHLNGCLAADEVVEDLADAGVIALQLHGNQDLEVDFKSLEILQPVQ